MRIRPRHLTLPTVLLALALPAAQAADGTVTTFAGTVAGYDGDGGPATAAKLSGARGAAIAADGSTLIADSGNSVIRRVTPGGTIATIAGVDRGFSGDGGPAADADLDTPSDVAVLPDGSILVADTGNNRIRRIAPNGVITTVAGSIAGFGGDGGPATGALLDAPRGLTALPGGGYLIADTGNSCIRSVSPAGVITTVAGSGRGFGGDGGPAISAQLSDPWSATPGENGSLLIADTGNGRVRRVGADGVITTVAGGGTGAIAPVAVALRTRLGGPGDVLPLSNGGVLLTDALGDRLRRVTPLGTIVTIAGERRALGGDGGPASAASFDTPTTLTTQAGGGLLIVDSGDSRVRRLSALGTLPPPDALSTIAVSPLAGSVTVRPRATVAAIPLREPDLAPNASVVDATAGTIDLTVAALDSGADANAQVSGGRFLMVQPVGDTAIADLRLNGPLACPAGARSASHAEDAKAKKKKKGGSRRVRIKVRGKYRTSGRYAVAVANGTAWTITDRCDRTTIAVTEGTVSVRDLRLGKTVRVKAGRTYVALARAPKATRKS